MIFGFSMSSESSERFSFGGCVETDSSFFGFADFFGGFTTVSIGALAGMAASALVSATAAGALLSSDLGGAPELASADGLFVFAFFGLSSVDDFAGFFAS